MLAIVAGILVARHLKTTDDLFDTKSSPESLVARCGSVGRNESCGRLKRVSEITSIKIAALICVFDHP